MSNQVTGAAPNPAGPPTASKYHRNKVKIQISPQQSKNTNITTTK
jgi:hypothetical protein